MNRNIKTTFGPETRFEIKPAVAVFRATQETEFDRLKAGLLNRTLAENPGPELNAPLRQAANEAAAWVWETRFPLLFFPELFAEKTRAALRYTAKHREIRMKTQRLFARAA